MNATQQTGACSARPRSSWKGRKGSPLSTAASSTSAGLPIRSLATTGALRYTETKTPPQHNAATHRRVETHCSSAQRTAATAQSDEGTEHERTTLSQRSSLSAVSHFTLTTCCNTACVRLQLTGTPVSPTASSPTWAAPP
jgi:hypothetical protein